MARALTQKQEAFALAYVETGNASEAYRRAYSTKRMKPTTVSVKACELLKNGKITVRLEDLQKAAQERTMVTVESLTAELEVARELALKEKQSSASVAATMGKAKLHGLLVDKHEHESPKGTMTPKGMGDFYASAQPEEK